MFVKEPGFGIRFVHIMVPEHTIRSSRKDRSVLQEEIQGNPASVSFPRTKLSPRRLTLHPGSMLIG